MRTLRWTIAGLAALVLGLASVGWAENLSPEQAGTSAIPSDRAACEMESTLLVRSFEANPKTKGIAGQKAKHRVKILTVDLRKGLVTAQILQTGEVVTFAISASMIKKRKLRSGQTHGVNLLAAESRGRCQCGQKGDGSCWCTGEWPCCGPLRGCPIGSCGKKQPIPNVKPEVMTP